MTSDNIAEYVGENNQFTEKPVTEYPPVIQDNTATTKDSLYSNNIDTDLLVVIGGLVVILFLMMLVMYFINSLRHKELTEILTKISFPEKSGSNPLKPEEGRCNLLSLCVLAPVFCTPKKLAEVSRQIIVTSAQEIAWTPGRAVLMVSRKKILPGLCRHRLMPINTISSIKRPVFLLTVATFMNRARLWIIVNGYAFLFRSSFHTRVTGLKYCA